MIERMIKRPPKNWVKVNLSAKKRAENNTVTKGSTELTIEALDGPIRLIPK